MVSNTEKLKLRDQAFRIERAIYRLLTNGQYQQNEIAAAFNRSEAWVSQVINSFLDASPEEDNKARLRLSLDKLPTLFMLYGRQIYDEIFDGLDAFLVENSKVYKFMTGDLSEFSEVLSRFADVTKSISQTFEDNTVTKSEAQKVRSAWEELKTAGESFVVSTERKTK